MNPWVAIPTFLATVAWIVVVIEYQTRAKWWKGAVGVNTMGISLALALVLVRLSLLQLGVVFDAWGNIAFGMGAYLSLATFGFHRAYLIKVAQDAAKVRAENKHNRRYDDPK